MVTAVAWRGFRVLFSADSGVLPPLRGQAAGTGAIDWTSGHTANQKSNMDSDPDSEVNGSFGAGR